ncbi:MAG: hypothetical protein ACP5RT_01710 [Candidatus Micrarchaeia archaeon]
MVAKEVYHAYKLVSIINKFDKFAIRSKIILSGSLKSNLLAVKDRMALYPGFVLISEGDELEYVLVRSESSVLYKLSLSLIGISLTSFSEVSPELFEKEHLLRLFSIAQLLSDLYSFDINSIFSNLIHLLSSGIKFSSKKLIIKENRGVEQVLAKRIILLHKKNEELILKNRQGDETAARLLAKILTLEDFKGSREEAAKIFNVDLKIVDSAFLLLNNIKQKGDYFA